MYHIKTSIVTIIFHFLTVLLSLLMLLNLCSCQKPTSVEPEPTQADQMVVRVMTFNIPGGGMGGGRGGNMPGRGTAATIQRMDRAGRLASITELQKQIANLRASIQKGPATDPNISTLEGDSLATFMAQYNEENETINQIARTISSLRPFTGGRGGRGGTAGGLSTEAIAELAALAKEENATRLAARLDVLAKETQAAANRGGMGTRGGGMPGGQAGNRSAWDERFQIVCDILRNHQIDIVGFQEVTRLQLDQIREALPEYGEVGVAREDGQTRGEYCAILHNTKRFMMYEDESGTFWLSETPEVPGSRSWNTSYIRICTWARFLEKKTGNAFYFFNTHLDVDSQWAREEGALLILERIKNKGRSEPFILTGDFNAIEQEQIITFIKGQTPLNRQNGQQVTNSLPLIDTFRALYPERQDVRTRHDWTASREGDKVDYIFVSPDVNVLEAQIVYDNVDGQYPSDHYPVSATVGIPAD